MKRLTALFVLLALSAAACGGDDDDPVATGVPDEPEAAEPAEEPEAPTAADETPAEEDAPAEEQEAPATETPAAESDADDGFPITVTHGLGELTIESRPTRVVSLSATATETLFAIGAGPQVVAVDDQSNFPAEAPMTDLSAFTPNIEAIIGFGPDLVVSPGLDADSEAALAAAGIASMQLFAAATFEDAYAQIETLGAATGNIGGAAEVVGNMQSDIDAMLSEITERETPIRFFHELDPTPFSATSATFIGQVYALAGLENIADANDPEGFGYPQLSGEDMLEEDPDLIFLADTKCCGENAATLAERPGWDQLTAVQSGNVIELDDDIASRWGPRMVEFLRVILDATAQLETSVGG